jgi:hypothetical protein
LIRRMLDLEWNVTVLFSRSQSMCRWINYFWMFLRGWYALFCGLSISVWTLALLAADVLEISILCLIYL